jgi:putative SOS response-associated peptidase YedK
MCAIDHISNQFTLELFDGEIQLPPIDRWNFPKNEREIVRTLPNGRRILEMARWGLEPEWLTSKVTAYNARSDSLAQGKPLFRAAFRTKRCLLFATSFIEHCDRRPSRIPIEVIPSGGRTFAYAGLFETKANVMTCTMVTCDPCEAIAPFHSRMPVILPEELWEPWLNPDAPSQDLLSLLNPLATPEMEIRDANLPKRDRPRDTTGSLF